MLYYIVSTPNLCLVFKVLSISEGSVFQVYLEVATADVVPRGVDKTFPPYIDIVLIFLIFWFFRNIWF